MVEPDAIPRVPDWWTGPAREAWQQGFDQGWRRGRDQARTQVADQVSDVDRLAMALWRAQFRDTELAQKTAGTVWRTVAQAERDAWSHLAAVALTEANRLFSEGGETRHLPEGGQTRVQWGTFDPKSGGSIVHRDERAARQRHAQSLVRPAGEPYHPCQLVTRTITEWSDGTQMAYPWQVVEDEQGDDRG